MSLACQGRDRQWQLPVFLRHAWCFLCAVLVTLCVCQCWIVRLLFLTFSSFKLMLVPWHKAFKLDVCTEKSFKSAWWMNPYNYQIVAEQLHDALCCCWSWGLAPRFTLILLRCCFTSEMDFCLRGSEDVLRGSGFSLTGLCCLSQLCHHLVVCWLQMLLWLGHGGSQVHYA